MTREFGDIVREFERRPDEAFALATLVRAEGSSYRRPGARMLIARDGRTAGSLSGGCLEDEVVQRAREVIRTGEPATMEFDTRRRFGCHGAVEIFIERAGNAVLAGLAAGLRDRSRRILATVFESGRGSLGTVLIGDEDRVPDRALVQQIDPSLQLIVIGDGPDSGALGEFARTLGWKVIAVESVAELSGVFDEWTAVVVKTHNYGRDFAALHALLPLELPYIGLLGPRRRRDQLLGDLLDTGVEASPNLFAPAGLDLGSEAPESIALAIIAEIQVALSGGSSQPLRARKTPIHADFVAPAAVR